MVASALSTAIVPNHMAFALATARITALPGGEDTILRADGGNHDIGYPRSVQRPDGKMVTVLLLQ